MNRRGLLAAIAAAAAVCTAPAGVVAGAPSAVATPTTPIYYGNPARWLARPTAPTKPVDVFYLYPSAYERSSAADPVISAVTTPSMVEGAQRAFARQATAFRPVANIWAPYYRQVDLVTALSLPVPQRAALVARTPTIDARAAFGHFITHDNHNRPFILVSHSQGSQVMLNLLSGYIRHHRDVRRRMIAAYVIGVSVTPAYLRRNGLRFATGPDDTGVIISYNTETAHMQGTNPILSPGGLAINPITWTRTTARATTGQSLGSYLPDSTRHYRRVAAYADARVDPARGVIICSTCKASQLAPGVPMVGRGILHSFDYPLYYFNLRANAANRVRHFLAAR